MHALIPSTIKRKSQIETIVKGFIETVGLHYDDGGISLSQLIQLANSLPVIPDYNVTFEKIRFDPELYLGQVYLRSHIISLNSLVRMDRIPFILGHEIGHIALNHSSPTTDKDKNERIKARQKQEIEANYFAHCLVMPQKIFCSAATLENYRFRTLSERLNLSREYVMKRYVTLKKNSIYFEIQDGKTFHFFHTNPSNLFKLYSSSTSAKRFIDKHKLNNEFKAYKQVNIQFEGDIYDCKIFNTKTEFGKWVIQCIGVKNECGWQI